MDPAGGEKKKKGGYLGERIALLTGFSILFYSFDAGA
jgi:hypothetical protein